MNVGESLASATIELESAGIPEAVREAASLLQFVIGRDRTFIVAHPEYELTGQERDLFQHSVQRRAAREPFQHIVGRQEFYGLDFVVTPDVLIPRHETELIVEKAIELLGNCKDPRFLEIGVGSGCISVAILKNCPRASAIAVDIYEPAIEVASLNATMHGVKDRLRIRRSDVFQSVPEVDFDLIAANPPYVPFADYAHLQPEVRDYDPRIAVTDGSTGLSVIERIAAGASQHLRSGGHLLMEIGFGQHGQVLDFFTNDQWESAEISPDLQGIPRMVFARSNAPSNKPNIPGDQVV